MATLTIATPAGATIGSSYAQNVGRAARALLAALFAADARTETPAKARSTSDDISLYRLYRMSRYDSVMPNLAQELTVIAGRQP
ncbi:MAG TPA: hypothetical protein VEC35_06375 [Noviherbaspirillum sp.]|nr:hypothetical protein [Noviherbaspirillum sp.]